MNNTGTMSIFEDRIFSINNNEEFNMLALEIFAHQYSKNALYRKYVDLIKVKPEKVRHYYSIPFMPIQFFKNHIVHTSDKTPAKYFESSGTGGSKSRHYYNNLKVYEKSFLKSFEMFYGQPSDYALLALLPSYSDNPFSSLIYMVSHLISESPYTQSGFYQDNQHGLFETLQQLKVKGTPCILFGVTFALLDFAQSFTLDFPELTIIETGGMKGKRKEIVRQEVHEVLSKSLNVKHIHSEYGMTELFSQAYAKTEGVFAAPPWMKVLCRDMYDPLSVVKDGGKGAINIIDLANYASMPFIATDDIGMIYQNGTFSISGRLDDSEMRGCNLMF